MSKYIYNQKLGSQAKRLGTSLIASAALLFNSVGVALPIILSQKAAAATTVTVQPAALNGWAATVNDGATADLVNESTSPLGDGALRMITSGVNESRARFNKTVNVKLSDVSDISFVSKLVSGPAGSANAAFRLGIDNDGNGSQDQSVVYEMYYNFDLTNASNDGTWQTWNVKAGKFWGSWNAAGAYDTNQLLNDIPGLTPDARITSIGVGLGTWNPSWNVLVDSVNFDGTTYDFEPAPYVPTPPPTKPAVSGQVIYDSTPNTLPSNSPSLGYQATSTSAFGDKITFAGTSRVLDKVAVLMSSWACQNGNWTGGCLSTPGSTFTHPITLNIYNVAGDGSVGSLIDSRTQTFTIPFRPTNDPTCSTTQWRDTNNGCFNGYNNVIVFDASDITVPDTVIYSIAYNTNTYGSSPIGTSGPFESLNVSLSTSTTVGTNVDTDVVFWDTTWPGYTAGLKADSGWSADGSAAVMFTAQEPPAAPTNLSWTPNGGSALPTGSLTNSQQGTLSWQDTSGTADHYKYYFWTNIPGYFEGQANAWSTEGSEYITDTPTGGTIWTDFYTQQGTYYFCVKAINAAGSSDCSQTFSVTFDNTAPTLPVHLSPADNSSQNYNDFYFDWTDSTDASALTYEFQASQSSSVDGAGALNSGVWNNIAHGAPDRNNLTTSEIHSYGANGTWYWQVRAIDAAGNKSAWTSPWKMTIDSVAPSAPANLGWVNPTLVCGATTNSYTISARWDSSADNNAVAGYQYWVTTPLRDASTAWVTTVGSNQYDGAFTEGEGLYTFKVRAYDVAGNYSDWSPTCSVTYDASAPAIPVATLTADNDGDSVPNGGTTDSQYFTFNLSSSSDTVRYQLKYWNDIIGSPFKSFSPWNPSDISGYSPVLGTYKDNFTQGEGRHYFAFSACDAAGNCSAYSAPFVVDYALPVVEEESPETPPVDETPESETPEANGGEVLGANTDNSNGNNNGGQGGGSSAPTVVAVNSASGTNSGGSGSSNSQASDDDSDTATPEQTSGNVLAETDNSDSAANKTNDTNIDSPTDKGCFKIFGICWYWWIPVVVLVVWLIYYIVRRQVESGDK